MKSLKQMRADKRVYEIRNVEGEDFNEGIKYEISLQDGYAFDDGTHLEYVGSVAELNELFNEIHEE